MNWKLFDRPLGLCDISGGYAPQKKAIAWVPIIMAAASIASTAYGASKSAQANRKARNQLSGEQAKLEAERRRKMNESYLDTAAGQNIIRQARREADRIWKREQGAAAVSGATEASKQLAKEAGNNMMADAIANIAANDTARKDKADEVLGAQERQLNQQQIGLEFQKGQNIAQAAQEIGSALMQGAISSIPSSSMGAGSPGGGNVTAPNQSSGLLAGMGNSKSYFENYANNYIKNNMYGTSPLFSKQSPLFTTDYRQFFGLN